MSTQELKTNEQTSGLTDADKQALNIYHADLKRHLKHMSKNELIRIVANQTLELYILKESLKSASPTDGGKVAEISTQEGQTNENV